MVNLNYVLLVYLYLIEKLLNLEGNIIMIL